MKLICITLIALSLIGCAAHTLKHDRQVESFLNPWVNQPFEKFLDEYPDVQEPIPLGQGRIRHTYLYDIRTELEAAAEIAETYRDDFYTMYLFVNEEGMIYKVDYIRRTAIE